MLTRRYFRLRTLGRLTLASVAGEAEVAADRSAAASRGADRAGAVRASGSARRAGRDVLGRRAGGTRATLAQQRALRSSRPAGQRRDLRPARPGLARRRGRGSRWTPFSSRRRARRAMTSAPPRCTVEQFLPGVHVPDAPEFDDWASRERARLERQLLELCERHVPALVRVQPLGGRGAARRALARGGAAIDHGAHRAAARARRARDPGVARRRPRGVRPRVPAARGGLPGGARRLGRGARRKLRERFAEAERRLAHDVSAVAPPERAQAPAHRAKRARLRGAAARWMLAAAATVRSSSRSGWRGGAAAASPTNRRIVAVTSIDDVRGDSAIAWLRAGLPRMIATDLDATGRSRGGRARYACAT